LWYDELIDFIAKHEGNAVSTPLEDSLYNEFSQLTPDQQFEALQFVRALNGTPRGTPGSELMEFVGTIPHEDLELMKQAIEEDCEQVDPYGW
jgi:hypothetical protein